VSSKRDLVEAHSFSRRRLVTAFVSGAPGGREVEPVRPGRMIIGGVAIAVLLVAGAAVAGVIKPRTPEGWLDPGVVIAKETGADYAILEKGQPLRPLVNATSAQLLFGTELAPKSVAQDEINGEEIGPPVGIYGAPDALPTDDRLVGTGWTACTNGSGGTMFRIASSSGVTPVTGHAVLVEDTRGAQFLVAVSEEGGFQLPLPSDEGDRTGVLNAVTTGPAEAMPVTSDWLNLFPSGPALSSASFPVRGDGKVAPYAAKLGDPQLRIGELVATREGQVYLVGDDGPVPLSGFAQELYLAASTFRGEPKPISTLEQTLVYLPARWPEQKVERLAGSEACAVLDADAGKAATVSLGAADADDEASAAALGDKIRATVEPGLGAYVLAGGHFDTEGGQPVVVDSQGTRYRLGGAAGEAAERLGYADYDAPTIPEAWLERYTCGPELSVAAAQQAPHPDPRLDTSCRTP
jgi:type VII secretion protein EccB